MPSEYVWRLLLPDCGPEEVDSFLDHQKPYRTLKSQPEPCQTCMTRMDGHKMHYVIYRCASPDCAVGCDARACPWHIKVLRCTVTDRSVVFQHGLHLSTHVSPTRPKLNRTMKRVIRELTRQRLKPSRILNRLIDDFQLGPRQVEGLLVQVQRYASHYRRTRLNDSVWIDVTVELTTNNRYSDTLEETAPFAFAYDIDDDGNPRLGDGSEEDPFLVGFATKASIRNLAHAATSVVHVDATYKTNTCGFPVIVLGVSDACRQFHPVAFFIASDARHTQYKKALSCLLAQYITRNAFEAVIDITNASGQPEYLMCFFHVMANVKKYTAGMSVAARRLAYRHVYRIHYTRTEIDLEERIEDALRAWSGDVECTAFSSRFEPQWLRGRFTKWYCIATPPGFAKTNNPVEQFNLAFKRAYTTRTLVSVNALFTHILSAANHYSVRAKPFRSTPRPAAEEIKRYKQLQEDGRLHVALAHRTAVAFLVDNAAHAHVFRVTQTGSDRHRSLPASTRSQDAVHAAESAIGDEAIETWDQPSVGWNVDVDNSACGCRAVIKNGSCVHLIACMVHLKIKVEGLMIAREKFATKRQKRSRGGHQRQVGHALSLE